MSTSDKKEIGFLRGQRNRAEKLAIEQAQEVGRLQEQLAQAKANADALAEEVYAKDRALDHAKWKAQENFDLWQERLDQVLKLEEENERLESALEDAQAQIQEVADISVEGEGLRDARSLMEETA